MRPLRVLAAVALVGAVLAWPSAAQAQPAAVPCIISPIGCIAGGAGNSLFCPSSKTSQVPDVRFSGDAPGLSADFDAAPADTGGQPPTTVYQTRGIHPFSYALFDEGCGGPVLAPTDALDTALGNWMLGTSIDLAAFANATHLYATHPDKWTAPIDRLEANATKALSAHIWTVFLPLSLLCLGVVILGRSHRRNMPAALKMAAWALLVLLIVTVAVQEPVRVGKVADNAETQSVSAIDSAMAGEQNPSPSAAGDLEMSAIIEPAWLKGELGSTTSPVAVKYGPRLLDDTSMTWAQAAEPDRAKVIADKQAAFIADATAIHDADPSAYDALKGQSDGRSGAAIYALGGVLVTVPFRILADLLVMAALALLRISVIFLPILGLFALHDVFAGMLRKLFDSVIGALFIAVVFSGASALQVVATGFLIGPNSGIPNWVGLLLSFVLMVIMFFALKPIRKAVALAPASTREGFGKLRDGVETATDLAFKHAMRKDMKTRGGQRPADQRPAPREADPGPSPADVPVRPAAEVDDRWGPTWEPEPVSANGNGNGNGHAKTPVLDPPAIPDAADWPDDAEWFEPPRETDEGSDIPKPLPPPPSAKEPPASPFNNEEVA